MASSMIIHCLCIDPERGKYLAYDVDDRSKRAISTNSIAEAVGLLIMAHPVKDIQVLEVETTCP